MAADLMQFYNDPSIAQAGNDAVSAGQTAGAYQSAASLLPQKLRQAVEEKINYNKDIIDSKNKAQADYFAAPATAREQYQGIFNPFTREKLVAQAVGNAYTPYASLSDILKERTGNISDIINSGVGAFNSSVGAANLNANAAQERYKQLLDLAGLKSSAYAKQYDLNHPSGSSGDSALSGLASLFSLMQGDNSQGDKSGSLQEPPATSQPGRTDIQMEYPAGSGVIWLSDGKGGWR